MFAVETYEILLVTDNIICFEIPMQEFNTIFDHAFQELPKLNLLNIDIIKGKYGINIDQTDQIMKLLFNNIGEQRQNMR